LSAENEKNSLKLFILPLPGLCRTWRPHHSPHPPLRPL